MKTYLSLILAAGLATAAHAQEAAAPVAAEPAAPAAVAAPVAPAEVAPAAPAVAAPAEPAPPPPVLPTTGDGAAVLSFLEKVCIPAVRGGSLDQLAPAAGMKKDRRSGGYTIALGGVKGYSITVQPMSAVNASVCQAEVHYAVGGDEAIVDALNIWSFLHDPELILQANYVNVDADNVKRTRKSWEHLGSSDSTAVNFTVWKKPDDSALNAKFDTGMLFYQERKF